MVWETFLSLQVPRKGASVWDPNFVIHREGAGTAQCSGPEPGPQTLRPYMEKMKYLLSIIVMFFFIIIIVITVIFMYYFL